MNSFWNQRLLNNSLQSWIIALSIIVASIIILRVLQFVLTKRLTAFVSKTKTTIDDFVISVVKSSIMPLLFVLAIHFGFLYLELPSNWRTIEHIALMIVVTFFVLRSITTFVSYGFNRALVRHQKNEQSEK